MKRLILSALSLLACLSAGATHYLGIQVVDNEYLMLHFRDGEVRYRDDATGPSAYLGHSFADGDDTLVVYQPRLDVAAAANASDWKISSPDNPRFKPAFAGAAWRKSKPMNTDHTLTSELDHWIFLHLTEPMVEGFTYRVTIPAAVGADVEYAEIKFDPWNAQSEAVHVNVLGYAPQEPVKAADLCIFSN